MAGQISISTSRTTTMLKSNQLLSSLRSTQNTLLDLQRQISTGRQLDRPSDAPARTSSVLLLESQIEARLQHERNLTHALGVLNTADAALDDATDILLEAKSIASSQIGVGSNAQTRANEATVIDAQLRALIDLANRQFQGISLFGGNESALRNESVFVSFIGGVRYVGSGDDLLGDVGGGGPLGLNTNGNQAFNALSNRVVTKADLDPQATGATRIIDVNGAQGLPVRLGAITVTVGPTPVTVDLAGSQTLGDVITRVNNAIDSVQPGSGQLQILGAGFELTASDATITDIGGGQTAADLGIVFTAGPGVGADINPKLTLRSELAALGSGIDLTNGMTITQGGVTKVADFSQAVTVEDMINVVNRLNLGLRMQINAQQTGLNLVSEVSGIELSIGENGGTTAEDLGLRTFGLDTRLDEFRGGLGIEILSGEDDFAIELHEGTTFNVNLDGAATVSQVIDKVKEAAEAAGVAFGSSVKFGLAPNGNGFFIEDGTTGVNDFRVVQLSTSLAATHLGIYTNAGVENTLQGEDLAKVRAESIFTHLIDLRDALTKDDQLGITLAGGKLDTDLEHLARIRADVGSRAKRADSQIERSQELQIYERQLLSELQDTDLTEAITRFTQLQQQLQASLSVGSMNLQLSLIDFLR